MPPRLPLLCLALLGACAVWPARPAALPPATVDATTLDGKVMCGYQGWFRCPGDAAGQGWIHWSRESGRIAPETLTFELWPDMTGIPAAESYLVPGFSLADGRPARLYSADSAPTVRRHFAWLRDYGLDGVWLQHFLVDLPGGPVAVRHASRLRVLGHVRAAAAATGRVWALSYDIAGMPAERIYDTLTTDWQRQVDQGVVADARYLHHGGRPVVQIWGFYANNRGNAMTPALAHRLIDFFRTPGRYAAYLVGGGNWDWRANPDPAWAACYRRLEAYCPWNVGNYALEADGTKRASLGSWPEDQRECARCGVRWIPVVYPGFGWDNLMRQPPGTSTIPRRRGMFLWEQFREARRLGVNGVYVAMFDEVDEGTAIYKVTNSPPTQGHFLDYEGLPSDWYLRLAGEGARMLRGERPFSEAIPLQP